MALELEEDGLRWFVVTGAPRSGTTMLARLLNSHPVIGCLNEIDLPHYIDSFCGLFVEQDRRRAVSETVSARLRLDLPDCGRADEGGLLIAESMRRAERYARDRDAAFGNFGFGTGPGVLERNSHASKVARSLSEIALGKSGLSHIGSKMPSLDLVATAEALAADLPHLRLIQIVRRPSDVINSSLARRNRALNGADVWHINTVADACNEWMVSWNRAAVARQTLGDRLLLVKYEDLVRGIGDVVARIADHLDVPAEEFDASVCKQIPEELRGYAYTPEESGTVEAVLGNVDAAWSEPLEALLKRFPRVAFELPSNGLIEFGTNKIGHYFGHDGFSVLENWGQWTDGDLARIDVKLGDREGDVLLTFSFQVWRINHARPQAFILSAGQWREVVTVEAGESNQIFQKYALVPRSALPDHSMLNLTIHILEAKRQEDAPEAEQRRLGLGIESLKINLLERV